MIALAVTTVCVSHRIYINKYFHHPAHSTAHTAELKLLFIFGYFAFDLLFFYLALAAQFHGANFACMKRYFIICLCPRWNTHTPKYTLIYYLETAHPLQPLHTRIRMYRHFYVQYHMFWSHLNFDYCRQTCTTITTKHPHQHTPAIICDIWLCRTRYARVTRNFPYHASMRKRFAAVPTNRKQVAATAVLNASCVCALFNGIGWFELYTVLFGCADETLFPRSAVFRTRSCSLLLLHLLVTLSFWEIVFLWVCL